VLPERLGQWKNLSDPNGNYTHDFLACRTVPERSALLRAPNGMYDARLPVLKLKKITSNSKVHREICIGEKLMNTPPPTEKKLGSQQLKGTPRLHPV
jgi:hypothetical protein